MGSGKRHSQYPLATNLGLHLYPRRHWGSDILTTSRLTPTAGALEAQLAFLCHKAVQLRNWSSDGAQWYLIVPQRNMDVFARFFMTTTRSMTVGMRL